MPSSLGHCCQWAAGPCLCCQSALKIAEVDFIHTRRQLPPPPPPPQPAIVRLRAA